MTEITKKWLSLIDSFLKIGKKGVVVLVEQSE